MADNTSEYIVPALSSADVPSGFTKGASHAMLSKIVEGVEGGYINPLFALAQLRFYEDTIKKAIDHIRSIARDEADKYAEQSFPMYGVMFEKKETGVKYDYSDDAEWCELKQKCESADKERKNREDWLKKNTYVPKSSTSSVAVTLQ